MQAAIERLAEDSSKTFRPEPLERNGRGVTSMAMLYHHLQSKSIRKLALDTEFTVDHDRRVL